MKRPRGWLIYSVYHATMGVLYILPRRFSYWLARRVCWFNYVFDRRAREGISANLRVILGPEVSEEVIRFHARQTFNNYSRMLVDFLSFGRYGKQIVERQMVSVGEERFAQAVKERNVIAISAHFGSWHLGSAYWARRGFKILTVVIKPYQTLMEGLYTRLRGRHGQDIVFLENAMRKCVQVVRESKETVVAVSGDRPFGEKGVEVDLFGHKAYFAQGPARMAVRADAVLYPVFLSRQAGDSYLVDFGEPIEPPESGSVREKARVMTQAYADQLALVVRRNPSQWFVFFKLFDPPGGVAPDPVRTAYEVTTNRTDSATLDAAGKKPKESMQGSGKS